jgi:hypothetical protein
LTRHYYKKISIMRNMNNIYHQRNHLKLGCFFFVDMTITSLKNIVEKLKIFESIFEFLYDSQKLKSLNDNDNDLFSKL